MKTKYKILLGIYYGLIIFFFGYFFKDIIFHFEKQFNNLQVCNNTKYNIDQVFIGNYKSIDSIYFSKINAGKCSKYKKSFWLSNKSTIKINFQHEGELYRMYNGFLDTNGYKKKKMGKHTITIEKLNLDRKTILEPIFGIERKVD